MIDPKLNEIPVDDALLTEKERLARNRTATAAQGLSINDTIARDANLSVGGTGVDVSGVSAGAGAGAGSTYLTPDPSSSTAPQVVPGSRGSGSTPLADAPDGETSTDRTSFDK